MAEQEEQSLVVADSKTISWPRRMWSSYQAAPPGWHIVLPVGFGAVAFGFLNWASNMLSQDEYGLAMLLVLFFCVIGIGASTACLHKKFKVCGVIITIAITIYGGLLVWSRKGDKPWTTLRIHPQPSFTPTPTPSPTPSVNPSPSTPAPTPSPSPSPRRVGKKVSNAEAEEREYQRKRKELFRILDRGSTPKPSPTPKQDLNY